MFPLSFVLPVSLHIVGVALVTWSGKQPPITLPSALVASGLSLSLSLLIVRATQLRGRLNRILGAAFVSILVAFLITSWLCRLRAGRFLSHLDASLLRYLRHVYTLEIIEPNLLLMLGSAVAFLCFITAMMLRDGQKAPKLPDWCGFAAVISTGLFGYLSTVEIARPAVLATLPEAAALAYWARESNPSQPLWYEPKPQTDEKGLIESERKRSVLIVGVEALRRDMSIARTSSGEHHMPYLAKLRERQLMYSKSYAQSTDSELSTRTILTGLYGATHELRPAFRLENSLLSWLRSNGYKTAFLSLFDVGWGVAGGAGVDYLSDPAADGGAIERSGVLERQLGRVPHSQEVVFALDQLNVERLRRWSSEQPAGQPLAAYLVLYGTHFPYTSQIGRRFNTYYFPPKDAPEITRAYEEALARADDLIATAISDFLRRDPNALIFVTGDHGEEFYEHGGYLHAAALSAEVMNVPLAVIGLPERCPQPAKVSRPVGHIDIIPTILDVLGVPAGLSHQGVSLCETEQVDRPLFAVSRAFRLQNAVIYGAKKNVISLDGYPQEAYDVFADPTEQNNLAANGEFTRDTDKLLHAFEQIQRKHHLRPEHWKYKPPRYEGDYLRRMLTDP